jgi:hypothetical protein
MKAHHPGMPTHSVQQYCNQVPVLRVYLETRETPDNQLNLMV